MPSEFRALRLDSGLLEVLGELGYHSPTPIQARGIPPLLEGLDLIGQARTGSGKTAAFALPILQRMELVPRTLQALVLCPTRELCAQVTREMRKLGRRHAGLQVLSVAGGEPVRPQSRALRRGVHIAVGTPGRVLDHLKRGTLPPKGVATLVLDEADRMLDMGFQADMEEILGALPKSRQTVFFSATFPGSIEAMSRAHQRNAVRITIEESVEATSPIRQQWVGAEPDEKLQALYQVLGTYPHESALVFCNFKASVADLERTFAESGLSADGLHGDLEQYDRDRVMARFRNQSVRLLVATDVAARGIDVEDLDLVVNYEMPSQLEAYVHRIGRTGRAGRQGLAISLVTKRERSRIAEIENRLGVQIERVLREADRGAPIPELAASLVRAPRMDTIRISGGRKDKMRPGDILGALTGEAGGLPAADVGRIEIHDRFSYVALSRSRSRDAIRSLNTGRIKGRRFRADRV